LKKGKKKKVVGANFGCSSLKVLAKHAVLLLGSFELAPRPGVFALFDFHIGDVQLIGCELT